MIKVGVIGVGNMGRHHARIYSSMEGVQLVGVADIEPARTRELASRLRCAAYPDYRDLLSRERPDAVSVAVPTRDHYAVACDVIDSGVDLLVEKPLAATTADAESMVAAAGRAGVILAAGHIERFNPAVQELKRRIDAHELGSIYSVVARRVGLMPPRVEDANVVIDLAVHDIDILNYIFGAPPEGVAVTAGRAFLSDRFDHAEIFLRYGAAGCFVQVNWITPLKIRTLSVTGDAGHAELNYVTQKLELYLTNAEREFDDFGDFVIRFGEAERRVVPVRQQEPLLLELRDFVDAVTRRRPPAVKGEDGIEALRVAERILEGLA